MLFGRRVGGTQCRVWVGYSEGMELNDSRMDTLAATFCGDCFSLTNLWRDNSRLCVPLDWVLSETSTQIEHSGGGEECASVKANYPQLSQSKSEPPILLHS